MRPEGVFPSLVQRMLRLYVERRIRSGLDGVWVRGMRAELGRPCILAPTHVAWWDAMLLVRLEHKIGGRPAIAMHAHNLQRYPFFRVFGCFGIDATSPSAMRAGLREATRHARDGPLWWFPQGTQRPSHLRPLGLQAGILSVARQAGVPIVPIALAYTFREAHAPAAFLDFGDPLPSDTSLPALEDALLAGLARIDVGDGFTPLEPPRLAGPAGSPMLTRLWNAIVGPPRG